jgi:hypothetical protein
VQIRMVPHSFPDAGDRQVESPAPAPPGTLTAALQALGLGLGTLFGQDSGWQQRGGGRGPSRSPAHVPRSDPRGEGVISAPRSGKRGAGASGRGRRPLPPPFLGRGSECAQVPSLGFDQLIPDPQAPGTGGKDWTGQGATRGRSHPFWAVGEGAARRALRSPGYAAERGTRAARAIPGSQAPG